MLENIHGNIDYFSLAGFAISEVEKDVLDATMTRLKSQHNINGILHWTDLRRSKNIWATKNENEIKSFLKDFTSMIQNADLTVFASLYNAKLMKNNVKSKKWFTHSHVYSMKKIIENFFIFLNMKNATTSGEVEGHIIVESSTIDEELKKLFHSVMIFGTDFISQQGLTKFIKNIEFIPKSSNNNLLQIADPMPSELHRFIKSNNRFSANLNPYKIEIQNLRTAINNKAFTGYDNRPDLFGVYIME